MNVLSLFDGMSCGQIALDRLNISVGNYFSSEIKNHAIKVTQKNYPNTIQVGDVTKLSSEILPNIDLLFGGSPCQSFSVAGDGSGFDGKSRLFWEFVRLLREVKPKYFLLEIVVMRKEWQQVITEALGVEPVMINSKLFTAQNRPRLYWTNIPFDKNICDKEVYLKDVLNVDTSRALVNKIDKIDVVEKVRVRKYNVDTEGLKSLLKASKLKSGKTISKISYDLGVKKTTVDHWFRNDSCFSIPEPSIWSALKGCLDIQDNSFDSSVCEFIEKDNVFEMSNRVYRVNGKSPTLTASCKKVRVIDDSGNISLLNKSHFELLQGVPAGYTDCLTDTQAMNVIGDGWTIDVITHIFKGLK
jgi:DNA (cytosine-5)-methyltransferase 3A